MIAPFLLEGEPWLVRGGGVDVFLVDLQDGKPEGPRRFVLRAEAGVALFAARWNGAGLLACPLPGAELSRDAVDENAMAQWREALASAAGLASTMPDLETRALAELVEQRHLAEERERQRLATAASQEAAAADLALRQLAKPLATDMDSVPADDAAHAGPLTRAAIATGAAMGVAIRAPKLAQGAVESVEAIARASNLRHRRVALKGGWWRKPQGMMLVTVEGDVDRPAAVIPGWRGARLFIPDVGTVKLDGKQAARIAPFGDIFYRALPGRPVKPLDLLAFGLRGAGVEIAVILVMGLASGLLGIALPIAMGAMFDYIIPGADRAGLLAVTAFLAAAAVASALFTLTRSLAVLRFEGRMDAALQAAVQDRLLSLPATFFRSYTAGDLAMRGLAISQIRQTLTGSTLGAILSGAFSIFSFLLMFSYAPGLAMVATALSAVAIVVPFSAGLLQVRRLRTMAETRGRLSGMVLQFVTGIAKLRVTGKELRAFSVWARQYGMQESESAAARRIANWLAVFQAGFPLACSAVIFYFNASGANGLSTGAFLAFHAAFFQFLSAMMGLTSAATTLLGVIPLFERARPILEAVPESTSGKAQPGELSGRIEVSRAFFRYRPDLPQVLRDFSLSVRPGEFVALVGASGCGKSTLLRLLLGFEQLESGAIHFDGQDLAGLDPAAVRRQIGVVIQGAQLQAGDILDNVRGSRPLTQDQVWEALRMSGLEEDVKAMPMGLHTVISESGGLSGGQRQRLAIARAVAGRPRILLFDEATSALDNRTQADVSRSLELLHATRIVIAHRLSTIRKADRICVVDEGRIVELGTYNELMAKEGRFAAMAKRQLI